MLILLPPSETKREGGDGVRLDLSQLRYPRLNPTRRKLIEQLRAVSKDEDASIRALRLGPRQRAEVARNRAMTSSPTMVAMDRYTGVVYDALDAASLPPEARAFAGAHLVIQSALFGPIGALDPIPAYRLSHDSRLPGIRLAALWNSAASSTLGAVGEFVLDLRSEGYAALTRVSAQSDPWFVRVVTESDDGQRRALNHFNKRYKGLLARALLLHGVDLSDVGELVDTAAASGLRLERGGPGELILVAVP